MAKKKKTKKQEEGISLFVGLMARALSFFLNEEEGIIVKSKDGKDFIVSYSDGEISIEEAEGLHPDTQEGDVMSKDLIPQSINGIPVWVIGQNNSIN